MKYFKRICFLIALSLIISCQSRNDILSRNNELVAIQVEPSQKDILNIDDVAHNIRYLKLETNKDAIISRIDAISVINNNFIVFDYLSSNSLYCFSGAGKFLYAIKPQGRGPNEIGHISDYYIDMESSSITIFDNSKHKIFVYDFEGSLVEQKDIDKNLYIFKAQGINKGIVACHLAHSSYSENNLIIGKMDFINQSKSYFPYSISFDDMFCSFIESGKDQLLYSYGLCDTVYSIDRNSLRVNPRYFIDFGKYRVADDIKMLPSHRDVIMKIHENEDKYAYIVDLRGESSKFLVFSYVYLTGTKDNFFIYNKSTRKGHNLSNFKTSYSNVFINGPTSFSERTNEFISVIEAQELNRVDASDKFSNNYGDYSELSKVIENTSSADNPVLVLFEIK